MMEVEAKPLGACKFDEVIAVTQLKEKRSRNKLEVEKVGDQRKSFWIFDD